MKKNLTAISEKHELDYYTNENNIPNQKLIKEIIEYFENGEGARVFKLLELLNLLWRQQEFVIQNRADKEKVLSTLEALPLNKLEKENKKRIIEQEKEKGSWGIEPAELTRENETNTPIRLSADFETAFNKTLKLLPANWSNYHRPPSKKLSV
jgi:hypothetical protein